DLVAGVILQLRRGDVHPASTEAHQIGQARVGADRDAVGDGQLYRLAHHVGVTAVKAARDVRGGDVRHHVLVVAQRPAPVALAHAAVDVDVGCHSAARTSLAIRSTWSG